MKTVFITGANGRFGQAAVAAFAKAGWHVLAQVRRAPVGSWPAGVQPVAVSMGDTDALVRAAAGTSVVVHALNPAYARWDTEAMPLLHQGLAVAQALDATFMLPGNVYNFGSQLPRSLREDTPQVCDHPKARIRIAMEDEMRRAAQEAQQQGRGLRCVVMRAGDFFGCGSGSWFDLSVVKDIGRGKLAYPGPLDLPHAWAYLPDLAAAFERVACAPPAAPFETLHFAGHTVTGHQLLAGVEAAATELGLRPPKGFRVGGMPWSFIRTVGLVYPMWRELARMSYLWLRPHELDGRVLESRVSLPAATPLVTALRQSLQDLGIGAVHSSKHARA
ncbi:MAG: epimerase [Betaproteobacteria bacterium]|jgi:nucleoside-diphosphate-sugar epimerase